MKSIIFILILAVNLHSAQASNIGSRFNVNVDKSSQSGAIILDINSSYKLNSGISYLNGIKPRKSCNGGVHTPSSCVKIYEAEASFVDGTEVSAFLQIEQNRTNKFLSLSIKTNMQNILEENSTKVVIAVPNLSNHIGLSEFKSQSANERITYSCTSPSECTIEYINLFGIED